MKHFKASKHSNKHKIKRKIAIIDKYEEKIKCSIVVSLTVIFSILAVMFSFKVYDNTAGKALNYSDKGNIDYKVKLKENEFYEESVQKSNMTYVSSLIDTIDLNLNYNLHYDNVVEYSYQYVVNADLYITNKNAKENEDSILFEDKEELVRSEMKKGTSSDIKVNENLSIPYEKYNSIVKAFAASQGIIPECYLDVSFLVSMDGKYEDIEGINKNTDVKLKIPLYEKLIDIDETGATKEDSGKFLSKGINMLWLVLAVLMGLTTIVFLIISIKLIIECIPKLPPYEKKLKDIFKKYDQLIVKSRGEINFDQNVTEVYNFEDLVNVSDRIQQPIKFYEILKNEESIFVVDNLQKEYYVYHIKS